MASRSASGTDTKGRADSRRSSRAAPRAARRTKQTGDRAGKGGRSKGSSKASTKGSTTSEVEKVWESRAVLRLIEAGSTAECPHCQERVKFRARHRDLQVICNVYVDGKWDRVEQYHQDCYREAGHPHGEPVKK